MHALGLAAASFASLALAQPQPPALPPWPSQKFVTEPFHPPNLTIEKTGETAPGYLFFAPGGKGTSSPAPLIMTDDNELIWHGPNITTLNPENFRIQTNSDKSVLSWWDGFGFSEATFGHGLGRVHLLDNTYKEINNICQKLDLYYVNLNQTDCMIDNHESWITDHGTIIVTAFNVTQHDLSSVGGPKNGYIFDALFYELDLKTQAVVFKWSALEHLDKFPLAQSHYPLTVMNVTSGNVSYPYDYFHINSVQQVSEGYLVNSRYFWTTFLVRPDGSVKWRLEGNHGRDFTLAPDIFFSVEHMPRVRSNVDGIYHITLFNNDQAMGGGVNASSGLDLRVDTNSMQVTQSKKLVDPKEKLYTIAQGSYQSICKDHVLLGYGSVPVIKEFDASGKRVSRIQFGSVSPTPKKPNTVTNYRAYKQEWHATPYYAPKTVGKIVGGKTQVWMSWNGATDYTSWNIYAGDTKDKLVKVASAARRGFETTATLGKAYKFVQVQALEKNVPIRKSDAVAVGAGGS